MGVATQAAPTERVEHLQRLIGATTSVMETMLECRPNFEKVLVKRNSAPSFQATALIRIDGKADGIVAVSLSREAALKALERLVGLHASEIDAAVQDAVSELANMIVGSARANMGNSGLRMSVPRMIVGRNHIIPYPTGQAPIAVGFTSDIGPFAVEVGMIVADRRDDDSLSKGEPE